MHVSGSNFDLLMDLISIIHCYYVGLFVCILALVCIEKKLSSTFKIDLSFIRTGVAESRSVEAAERKMRRREAYCGCPDTVGWLQSTAIHRQSDVVSGNCALTTRVVSLTYATGTLPGGPLTDR